MLLSCPWGRRPESPFIAGLLCSVSRAGGGWQLLKLLEGENIFLANSYTPGLESRPLRLLWTNAFPSLAKHTLRDRHFHDHISSLSQGCTDKVCYRPSAGRRARTTARPNHLSRPPDR